MSYVNSFLPDHELTLKILSLKDAMFLALAAVKKGSEIRSLE